MSVTNNREIPFLSLIEHRKDNVPLTKSSDLSPRKLTLQSGSVCRFKSFRRALLEVGYCTS